MTHIGLISETHSYLDEDVFEHFKNCDEIWHGGDFPPMLGLLTNMIDECIFFFKQ